jgi:hypothetical protein
LLAASWSATARRLGFTSIDAIGIGASSNDQVWPRTSDELAEDPIPRSFINQPLPPDNVIALRKSRPLCAVLVENLNSTKALLRSLEDGVTVSQDAQCEIIRLLFVATRHQVQALAACLELDGLE